MCAGWLVRGGDGWCIFSNIRCSIQDLFFVLLLAFVVFWGVGEMIMLIVYLCRFS